MTSQDGWLTLDKTEGTAAAATSLQVRAAPGNLPIGRYQGSIEFAGEIAQGLPRTIPVQLIVASQELAPSCQQADRFLVDRATASLKLEGITTNDNPDGSCTISAYLVMKLPQNSELRVRVQGTIDAQNRLNALVQDKRVVVKIASFELTLTNILLSNQGATADASWNFGKLSSAKPSAGKIKIDQTGLTFNGSQSFEFKPAVGTSLSGFAVSLKKVTLKADTRASSYLVDLDGTMAIGVGGVGANADVVISLNSAGIHSSKVKAFKLVGVAGLDLAVGGAVFSGDSILATSASFKVPDNWGGGSASLTGVRITKAGKITIGGGSFALPPIQAGGYKLSSLRGSFATEKGKYIISADGRFALPVGSGSGSCTLDVGVTLRTGSGRSSVLEINSDGPASLAPLAADGLEINRILIGVWDCPVSAAIPIGATGFYLTGVRGTIELRGSIDSVKIDIQVRTGTAFSGTPLIGAEASATFYTKPPALDFQRGHSDLGNTSRQSRRTY